jgi:hypothetical protein
MDNQEQLRKIDHSSLKVNQLVIIGLNILAFVLNAPGLVMLTTLVMLLGALLGKPGFGLLYQAILKPAGIVKPVILLDHPQPHRFAQALGGLFMALGSIALLAGTPLLGWGLVWLVAGLAALNALAGFCVGCMLYYWLARLKAPGFTQTPPGGAFPGMRPDTKVFDA